MKNEKLKQAIAAELCKQKAIGISEALDSFSFEAEDGLFYSWKKVHGLMAKSSMLYEDLPQDEQQRYLDKAERIITEASNG